MSMKNFFGFKNSYKRTEVKQHDFTDCGAACLAAVASFHHLEMPIAKIRQMASTDRKGTNVLGLIEAAKKLGFDTKGIRLEADQLELVPVPVIAHVIVKKVLHHYVVVLEVKKDKVLLMDPAEGKVKEVDRQIFEEMWTGVMLLLQPGETFERGDFKASIFQRFWFLLKPHKRILTQVLLGAIVATILGLASSFYLQKIIDNVLPEGNQNLLNLMGICMVVILVFRIIISFTKSILTVQTGQKIDARLILGYYKHLLKLPQSFFDNMRTGEIISRINDAVKIRTFINDVIIGFVINVFVVVFSFSLMFVFYWKLALFVLLIIPIYATIYYFSNKVNSKTQRQLMEDNAELESQLVESVNAISTIKRFGLEDFTNMRTESRFVGLLKSVYASSINSIWIGSSSTFSTSLFTILLLWIGSSFVLDNELTAGELLSFYAIMGYFTKPVASFIGMNKLIQDALIAADRLFEIMDVDVEENEKSMELTADKLGDIRFMDVEFRYGTRKDVFKQLDLDIPLGKITAIVGESGSGKSTLLSLLQKIYPLDGGRITIGEYDLKYIDQYSLRKLVGVVPQDIHLFAGSVMDNLALGEFNPDMTKVIKICKRLGILNFIESLPKGFDTYIGENGVTLSGGQRQRLAIARALYKEPEVLIFDEATSSLDSYSESFVNEVLQSLQKEGKTVVVIAHRLSSVMQADQILVLKEGKLVEKGNHTSLIKAEGVYHEMWKRQVPTSVLVE
ncbi:peptidase domain-containing ABC transporter [Echinicola rosea]|uniref:Bacteriocin cleavage/export ABC transporter n=1 Tax=Echinicola rosea TaxID=1807691 RepID=A0ABQ1V088_9BACT|nr:peptidase domain-containing ABC transporter [Echinicola rosea]GGF29782.1 bacteriocin cleavage/export ABC transporter [Echinicola rosea]